MTEDTTVRQITEATERTRRNVAALGDAIGAAQSPVSPSLARAVQAEHNLYETIDVQFGLLTSTEAGQRMGSRATALRNAAAAARRQGRLLGLRRGGYVLFPGFQFDHTGIRPVIAELIQLGDEHGRTETGLIQWLMAPTTYLDGKRPVDALDEPDRVLRVARDAFGIQW